MTKRRRILTFKLLSKLFILGLVIGLPLYFYITMPKRDDNENISRLVPNSENGQYIFIASGCASCHEKQGEGDANKTDPLVLSGGLDLPSPFGTFYAPNISMSKDHGIGSWTLEEFSTALRKGVSPKGKHYFPAFPYTSYTRMRDQDVVDLFAYMKTLKADETASKPHDISFPFNIRRNLGLWKMLFLNENYVNEKSAWRGRYLVEGVGHCAECHTPRNILGGLKSSQWLEGAANPSGKGDIPPITQDRLKWSKAEILEYFTSGFTPEYDMVGGHMAKVVENLSRLQPEDREAIADYLLSLQ